MPLPTRKPDPHADVEVHDYSTAHEMSRSDLLTMKGIATSRGEKEAAFKWGTLAVEKQRVEEAAEAMDKQFDAFRPHEVPVHGAQILEPMTESWQGDTEYLRLQDEWRQAQATADAASEFGPDRVKLTNAAVTAREKMAEREKAIKDELAESGLWTDQNQRTAAAQASLREKAAQVEAQVKGQ